MPSTKSVSEHGSRDSDKIILIMGATGVGKSTFINIAADNDVAIVGHELESCTKDIKTFAVPYRGDPTLRVIFVDTPGFDDTWLPDTEILRRVAVWLETSYRSRKKLAGIIYAHEISRPRMLRTANRNFNMFKELCGGDGARNTILVTTKWGLVEDSVGKQRQQDLANLYWKEMLERGSRMDQFLGTPTSAWNIVDSIVINEPITTILIQKELVDLRKILPETSAAIALRHELEILLQEQKEQARMLKDHPRPELQGNHDHIHSRIRSTLKQIQELQVPLSRRVRTMFGFA